MLCCNGTEASVSATLNIHSDHFDFEYGTADIICQILEVCPTLEHVAINSKSPKETVSLQDIHAFQPVRNQQKQEVFRYEFTVCISAMYDYENVLLLVQAMEMFKILGVQKVAIYKTNCSPVTQKVLDYYISQDFVELIPWSVSSYINLSRGWETWKVCIVTFHGFFKSVKGIQRVNTEVARMYHIKNFIKKDDAFKHNCILRDTHLRDYADRLIPAVSGVLQKALNLPKV
ncbi:uncharacterized protein LOC113634363 isoform X1 [Tachysurus ichikawai]